MTKQKPEGCDLCKVDVGDQFVDGKTLMGPWADMCMSCHANLGVGLGLGKGQHYKQTADGLFVKVAG